MHLDVKKEDHDQSCWYWVDSSPFVRCLALYFGVSWIHILQSDKPHGADPVQRRPCGLPHGWFSKSSCICLVSMSHFSCDAIITPHRLIHRSSHTFSEVVVRLNALFPQTTLTMFHPAASTTGPAATFSTGRDECISVWAAPPWVFRAHPGGSNGNGRAGALLPTPVIIYRPGLCGNRAVMDSDGGWWSLFQWE